MTKDLTKGSPLKLIFIFTLPVLVGNIFQQLYAAADTLIVGRAIGVNALASVGATGSLNFLFVGFAIGACGAIGIITARRFGEKDEEGIRRSFAAGLILTLIISAILTALTVPLTRVMLSFLNTPAEIIDGATSYLRIFFAGLAAIMLYNFLFNVMRAVGNSRAPLIFLIFACIINIALDYVIILNTSMGVAGAALATVISQLLSAFLCLIYIRRRLPILWPAKQDFKNIKTEVKEAAALAVPMGFQSSIIAIGALAVTYAINGLGAQTVAAITTAQRIDMFSSMPLSSFGITIATFTSQNYGAGKYERIRLGVRQACAVTVIYSIFACVMFYLFGGHFASIFLGEEPAVAAITHKYLKFISPAYFVLAILFVTRGSLQGMGRKMATTISGVFELIMRCFAALILGRLFGFEGVALAAPLAWVGGCIPLVIAYKKYIAMLTGTIKKRRRLLRRKK